MPLGWRAPAARHVHVPLLSLVSSMSMRWDIRSNKLVQPSTVSEIETAKTRVRGPHTVRMTR